MDNFVRPLRQSIRAAGSAVVSCALPWPALCRAGLGVALWLAFHAGASAQVYVGTSQSGDSVVLSNFQTQETPNLLLAKPVEASLRALPINRVEPRSVARMSAKADRWREVIDAVATTVDISPQLVHAVISAESNYDPQAVSPKGAIGLMQLMPATAQRFGVKDPFVVRDNVYAGASYLKWLMGYFHGDIELVLAAYNAGEQAVVRAGHKVPRYPETQTYVQRVMAKLRASDALPL
jgi:soluble lytic murein transglycosylase-like protein